ncbi:hypothetical protein OEZ85_012689 [Tetradesmus obliquus]|uniref:Dilute domain-containing protein n=1 Tax=Tetradesmus obliquus TaxID=3088 RepID=A0ABY8U6A5_TETOB|nr:hypothetical protein OEZ85_012689 [Tetradesmus obliquus]
MSVVLPTFQHDEAVWKQPAGAAAVAALVGQLGPAVLHAAQQQQPQQQQKTDKSQKGALHCQYALWHWAVAVVDAVGAANPEHVAAATKQSPESFSVSLCAALRVLCAVTCSRASPGAAAASAGTAGAAALEVATTVACYRTECKVGAARQAWLQQQAAHMPLAELRRLCSQMSGAELRERLLSITTAAVKSRNAAATTLARSTMASMAACSDSDLQGLLDDTDVQWLQQLVTWSPAGEAAEDDVVLPTGNQVGRYGTAAVIAAGPLVTFQPGELHISSRNRSSRSCSSSSSST